MLLYSLQPRSILINKLLILLNSNSFIKLKMCIWNLTGLFIPVVLIVKAAFKCVCKSVTKLMKLIFIYCLLKSFHYFMVTPQTFKGPCNYLMAKCGCPFKAKMLLIHSYSGPTS